MWRGATPLKNGKVGKNLLKLAVIGTVFMDCKGFALQPYNPIGRNLGAIQFVHGGVGRNVAENLAMLNLPVSFVSTIDKTGIGNEVLTRLAGHNIDSTYIESAEQGMGMWLAVMNEAGDLAGSISQMPNLSALENIILSKGHAIVEQSSHIVLELDLNDDITRSMIQLARRVDKPVYGIPGNLAVILRNPHILEHLECFICNHVEAERLIGSPFEGLAHEEQQALLQRFVNQVGMQSMVVTLGSDGSVFYDRRSQTAGYQAVFPVQLVDSSGAGDAFFSGTVMGLVHNRPLAEAVIYGTKVAGWTIQSKENTCSTLGDIWQEEEYFRQLKGKLALGRVLIS